ncbi:hypothetical protein C2E31_25880 [Rhodopirellula baltica]|nr:hypothetical protein C2E31_25880 [Rhodopirellula baltica]
MALPEHGSISVYLFIDHDGFLALGERISDRFEDASMSGTKRSGRRYQETRINTAAINSS